VTILLAIVAASPRGVRESIRSIPGARRVSPCTAVSTGPGSTSITRTPVPSISIASVSVARERAALVAA
jgi:hypothetical protein